MIFQYGPLALAERPRWAQLWRDYQNFYQVDLPDSVTERTWHRLHDGRIQGVGARDGEGMLQGFVHFLFHEDTWSSTPACYLQDLFVDPAARGNGCARQLIETVAQAAQSAGASPPYWLTHETNHAARRLYDRVASNHGFIQYSYSSELAAVRH